MPFPSCSIKILSFVYFIQVSWKRELLKVPFVAKTPIVFEFVKIAAGFIAGSIPINGTE